jgi:hypothetical protein
MLKKSFAAAYYYFGFAYYFAGRVTMLSAVNRQLVKEPNTD